MRVNVFFIKEKKTPREWLKKKNQTGQLKGTIDTSSAALLCRKVEERKKHGDTVQL